MPTGQQYGTNVPQTTLTAGISGATTNFSVASLASWPTPPFTAVFDIGTSTQEPIDVLTVSGNTITSCTRSIDGTSPFSHGTGATFTHADIGRDYREARSHIDASTSSDASGHVVHGLGGGSSVVGTTDAQTLSNKTLTSPTISGPNLSGTVIGTYTLGGTPSLPTISGGTSAASFQTTGLTGATATPSPRTVGASNSGPPSSGTFAAGDIVMDTQPSTNNLYNTMWYCVTAGTPGTWIPLNGRTLFYSVALTSGNSVAITVPQVFNHLKIVISARGSGGTAVGYDSMNMQFNSVATGSYSWESWFTTQGAAVMTTVGATTATSMQCAEVWNSHFATHGRGYTEIFIPNYRDASAVKGFTSQSAASDGSNASIMQTYSGAASAVTAAITTVGLTLGVGNFIEGELSAYGIL